MSGTTSLSRTYRPQTFDDLVNQRHIRLPLEREIITDRIGHAYIFTGPRGVGKTTTARIFAKAINCRSRKGAEPCGKCEHCLSFAENRALDIIELDAASHTQVDHVREHIIPNARTRPSLFPYKVFIIDEVHMLSTSAFNALLKIIEEPPEYVVFIFATTDIERVPETIISRCQRFDFRRLHAHDLIERLSDLAAREEVKVSEDVLRQIADLADGSIRDAESILSQLLSLEEKEITAEVAALVLPRRDRARAIALLIALAEKDAEVALRELHEALAAGTNVTQVYVDLITVLREHIAQAISPDAAKDDLVALAPVPGAVLARWLRNLIELEEFIRTVQIPELPLELFILEQSSLEEKTVEAQLPSANIPPPRMQKAAQKKNTQPDRPAEPKATSAAAKPVKISPKAGQELQALWNRLVLKVGETSHSLAVVLKICQPKEMTETTFVISAAYPFHREQLLEHKNRTLLQKAILELTGHELKLESVVERVAYTRADDIPQRLDQAPFIPPASASSMPSSGQSYAQKSSQKPETGDSTWDKVLQAFNA